MADNATVPIPAATDTPPVPDDGLVAVSIDGKDVRVAKGSLVLDAATEVGVHIPIYCAHPKLDPVAVCRMCLVHIEKAPKLQPACATLVSDGMVVTTNSTQVAKAREGMLEFLLINHPLDCPVCDRGGECDLQDFAVRYGPQTSRFPITEKAHAGKAIKISDKIELDQERCILCWRCTRYYDEITGEKELVLSKRGVDTVIDSFNGEPLKSEFQGNLPEVCPVGALTHRQYRFKARPWDLQRTKSVCPECSYGCNVNVDSRDFDIMRFTSRDNPAVDDMWLCDRGRYSTASWNQVARVRRPVVRHGSESRDATVEEAIAAAAKQIKAVIKKHGGGAIGVIGSAESTNQELWLLQRMAREVFVTSNIDHRLDGPVGSSAADFELGIAEIENCDAVLVLGAEPEANAPVLTLRLFKAATKCGVDVHRVDHDIKAAALDIRAKQLVGVIVDETHAEHGRVVSAALAKHNTTVKRLTICRGVNGRGAQLLGVAPGAGPAFANANAGKNGREILEAAGAGAIHALVLLGAQTVFDGDPELAARALKKASVVVAIETRPGAIADVATVLIPGHAYFEKLGSVTNVEGRVQRIRAAVPPSSAMPQETRVLTLLAEALGAAEWGSGDAASVDQALCDAIPGFAAAGNGGRIELGNPAVKS